MDHLVDYVNSAQSFNHPFRTVGIGVIKDTF